MAKAFTPVLSLILALPLVVGCGSKKSGDGGELNYEGSSTIAIFLPKLVAAFTADTNIKFGNISTGGSGKGFKAVMAGQASVGGMSRDLKTNEKGQKPYYRIIGYDAVAIFVHKDNPVADLSKEQLKGIFGGKITNWQDVGGPDAAIDVVTEVKAGSRATIAEFKKNILDGSEFGTTKEIELPRDCVIYVGSHIHSITHAALAFKAPNTKPVSLNKIAPSKGNVKSGAYLMSRPLLLIAKTRPTGSKKKFFEFALSAIGQQIVGEKFVPVR